VGTPSFGGVTVTSSMVAQPAIMASKRISVVTDGLIDVFVAISPVKFSAYVDSRRFQSHVCYPNGLTIYMFLLAFASDKLTVAA